MLRPGDLPVFYAYAACRHEDSSIFFSEDPNDVSLARRICAGCPVAEPCLAYAREHAPYGVWGGTTPEERGVTQNGRVRMEASSSDGLSWVFPEDG